MSTAVALDASDYHMEAINVRVADCFVDHLYQRGAKKGRIRTLTTNWNWWRYFPIVVARREDGRWVIIDGQQRWSAAQELGIEGLPAILVQVASREHEAELFVGCNSTSPVGAGDRFRAMIVFAEPRAVAIKAQVEAEGFSMSCLGPSGAPAGNGAHSRDPFAIDAVYLIEQLYDNGYLSRVLNVVQESWGMAPVKEMVTSPMLGGIYLAMRHLDRFEVSQEALTTSLSRVTVKELLDRGADRYKSMVASRSVPGGVAAVIVEHFNYRKQASHTVPPYDKSAARALNSLGFDAEAKRRQGLTQIDRQRKAGWVPGTRFVRRQPPLIDE